MPANGTWQGPRETPSVPGQLAWFAEYDKVPHFISIPATLHHTGPVPVSNSWVAVVVVSATTGKVLDDFGYSMG